MTSIVGQVSFATMDGFAKQLASWGFGNNKRRHRVQTDDMSPWTTSRTATADGMDKNLHGNRRISNTESCITTDEEKTHE